MKNSKFSESQNVSVLREGEAGVLIVEILRCTVSVTRRFTCGDRSTAVRAFRN